MFSGEMSIEDLAAKYAGAYDSDFEMPMGSSSDEDEEESDSDGEYSSAILIFKGFTILGGDEGVVQSFESLKGLYAPINFLRKPYEMPAYLILIHWCF